MFRYKCTIFRKNKMPDCKASCLWDAVIYRVLRPLAASLLTSITYKSKLYIFLKVLVVASSFVFIFCWFLPFPLIFTYIIIIIIIICHQLGLDRPVSASSNSLFKGFHVVFVHWVYNASLFLASCYYPFLLHVVADLVCIFFVSRQLVLLSTLPKFLHSFSGQKLCTCLFFWKISSQLTSFVFYPFL